MPSPYLKSKIEERASQSEVLRSLQTRASDEKRDLTDPERKTFDEIVQRLEALDEEIQRIKKFDEGAAKFAELVGAQKSAEEKAQRAHDDEKSDDDEKEPRRELVDTRAANFGKRFVESTAFKTYRGAGTSERMTLPGPASAEYRAAITTGFVGLTDYTGPLPQLWGGSGEPAFPNVFLDLIGRVATSTSAVLYFEWTPRPPADAAVVAEGDLKPEATMDVTEQTIALQTYAHWKALTRQALEDVPQIQTIIQNRLLAGVRSALEAAAVAALTAASANIPDATGDSLLEAIRVGIATVEENGFSPNAILVNPADAATLDLSTMGVTVAGPVRNGTAWGIRIVPSRAIAQGDAYVGDFATGETWFDRGTTDVYMSDSHADFFLRNQLVILAEARAAFAVTEPTALCEVTGPATAPASRQSSTSGTSTSSK